MTREEQPVGPRRLSFELLSDDDFELLTYLVVLLECPEAVRLRPPDQGADAALRRSDGKYARCWQSKRFTSHISWSQCEKSLDTAVKQYAMPHYTFCFARDLTGNQEELFKKRLIGRHKGVRVDWWGAAQLLSFLLGSNQGQRIQSYFYGDPKIDTEALMRAFRAGGDLSTGDDAIARLAAVADYFESHDPFYAYVSSTRPTTVPGVRTPGAVMSVEVTADDKAVRIDAVPRNAAALERMPQGRLLFPATPEGRAELELFQETLLRGGEATLRGVSVEFDVLPSVFAAMEPPSAGEITITSEKRKPAPWDARVRVATDRGKASLDVALTPAEPPSEWDGVLTGTAGGLTLTLLFNIVQRSIEFNWHYRGIRDDIARQAEALAVLDALQGAGKLTIEDQAGGARQLVLDVEPRPVDEFIVRTRKLIDDFRVIEVWTEQQIQLPDEITPADFAAIAEAAYIIRSRESKMSFEHVDLVLEQSKYEELLSGEFQFFMAIDWQLILFGNEHQLGSLSGAVDARVDSAKPHPESGHDLLVRIVPASEIARSPVFKLSKERPHAESDSQARPD